MNSKLPWNDPIFDNIPDGQLYRFALRLLSSHEDASDAVAITLIKLHRNWHRYDPDRSKFSTWVYAILRNTCIDLYRRKQKHSAQPIYTVRCLVSKLQDPFESLSNKEIHILINKLPNIYKDVLILYHFHDFEYRDISKHLDIPIGTVCNRIHRARNKLAVIVETEHLSTSQKKN